MFGFTRETNSEFTDKLIELSVREANLQTQEANLTLRHKAVTEVASELAAGKTEVLNQKIEAAKQLGELEHGFHKSKEEKGIELAKLDAQIEFKKELLKATVDNNAEIYNAKLKALQDSFNSILESKNEVIALMTTQIEVLTAKLTEIKIDSVQLTANLKTDKE